jgi:photosystem II stability/assembly factor-like uncharacterized protein
LSSKRTAPCGSFFRKNLGLVAAFLWMSAATLPAQTAWKKMNPATTATLRSACFASPFGSWIVVGDAGTILESGDSSHWTANTSGTTSALLAITYAPPNPSASGVVVTAGESGTILTRGSNSNCWNRQTSGTTARLNAVAFGSGVFLVVGEGGTVLTSGDGLNWPRPTAAPPSR